MPLVAPEGKQYKPFQETGIRFLIGRQATLLADQPGLGKTPQALGMLNAMPQIRSVLVVCPATLKRMWASMAAEWLLPHLEYAIHLIGKAETPATLQTRLRSARTGPRLLAILHYEQVARFCTLTNFPTLGKPVRTAAFLGGSVVDQVIVDECHTIRNMDTLRSITTRSITATRKLLLSGTPMCNHLPDLFACLNYLDPLTWQSIHRYIEACRTPAKVQAMHTTISSTLMLRRTMEEVLPELPAKIRQVIELPADGHTAIVAQELEAHKNYTATMGTLRAQVKLAKQAADTQAYRKAVEQLRAGRTAARADMARLRQATALAKLPQVITHLTNCLEDTDKIIVFAWHRAVMTRLHAVFAHCNPVTIDGTVNLKDRHANAHTFQRNPACRMLLGSLRVASEGLTLTAADLEVFAEIDWSPSVMRQCENRACRIGQTRAVRIHHLVFEGSLDAHISATLVAKQEGIDALIDGISPLP